MNTIYYSIKKYSRGYLLIAATKRGICYVNMAKTRRALQDILNTVFPGPDLLPPTDDLKKWTDSLLEYLDGKSEWPLLPFDIKTTAFRIKVWNMLRKIPEGTTLSYGEVAKAIGSPRSAQAVGSACASNPALLVIPCHRVTPASGEAGKFRIGPGIKRTLLELEMRHNI